MVLLVDNLSLSYDSQPLIHHLHLRVERGQWIVVLGRSGCGKSTLLKAIAGLQPDTIRTGHILFDADTDGSAHATKHDTAPNAELMPRHRQSSPIAYMAQQDALLPWLSIRKNVQLADRLHWRVSAATRKKADQLLTQVGLAEHAHKAPYALSGGQRQRAALARTLMQSAELILMDEPFSALDAITRLELQGLAAELLAEKTVMMITHDPGEAVRLADQIYVMKAGGLSQPFVPDGNRPRFHADLAQPVLQQRLVEALL